ncbi:MAG: hypothetical protein ACFFAH_03645 [Promethearchaeota archaeon]
MSLDPPTIKRLSFIKYLYQIAVEQSHKPEPQNSVAVLMFHDSIELFLELAAEFLGCNISSNTSFMGYFELINSKLSNNQLSQKVAMNRLNKSRVNLKHNGVLLTTGDIESFRVNAKNFFEENTQLVFEIELEKLSLIDLIDNDFIRNILKDAKNDSQNGDHKSALERLSIAYNQLTIDYEKSKKTIYNNSAFLIGENLEYEFGFGEVGSLENIKGTIKEIQNILKPILFNFDMRKYIKFKHLTPEVLFYGKKDYDKNDVYWHFGENKSFSAKEVDFCLNFIIECALKLQEFDFELEK